ncbi:hypothetical protein JOF53_007187 [Crossiella equi]|uniref:Uncharacterized protein n=1 Tax=Crossiella equi TaxID=130796 RepID=A0ABS5ARI9_9PSEU|nr:hypothetical protein [Crossiella equi]MBP2478315.1 hypothetical protein [Crossiella equi]
MSQVSRRPALPERARAMAGPWCCIQTKVVVRQPPARVSTSRNTEE